MEGLGEHFGTQCFSRCVGGGKGEELVGGEFFEFVICFKSREQ